jgi:hypothetical protein
MLNSALAKAALLLLCCAADLAILRNAWTGREVREGQFRHGYFEPFDDGVSLALDNVIRPLFPDFLITDADELGAPPGVSAVAPLTVGVQSEIATDSALAPYVVLGVEAALRPGPLDNPLLPGEARLAAGRTLDVRDGVLTLVDWDAMHAWRDDAARLAAIRSACGAADSTAKLLVASTPEHVTVALGHCALTEPRPAAGPPLLAVLAGPDWTRVSRRPGWESERWFLWPVVIAVGMRVLASWWGLGIVSTAALSLTLFVASFLWPIAAALTWSMVFALALAAAIVRAIVATWRIAPRRWRLPAAAAVLALLASAVSQRAAEPPPEPPAISVCTARAPSPTPARWSAIQAYRVPACDAAAAASAGTSRKSAAVHPTHRGASSRRGDIEMAPRRVLRHRFRVCPRRTGGLPLALPTTISSGRRIAGPARCPQPDQHRAMAPQSGRRRRVAGGHR